MKSKIIILSIIFMLILAACKEPNTEVEESVDSKAQSSSSEIASSREETKRYSTDTIKATEEKVIVSTVSHPGYRITPYTKNGTVLLYESTNDLVDMWNPVKYNVITEDESHNEDIWLFGYVPMQDIHENGVISIGHCPNARIGEDGYINTGSIREIALLDEDLEFLPNQLEFDYGISLYPTPEMYSNDPEKWAQFIGEVEQLRRINAITYNPYTKQYIATYYERSSVQSSWQHDGPFLTNIIIFDENGKEVKRFPLENIYNPLVAKSSWQYDEIIVLSENEIYIQNKPGSFFSAYVNLYTEEVLKHNSINTRNGDDIYQIEQKNIIDIGISSIPDKMYLGKGLLYKSETNTFYEVNANEGELIPIYTIADIIEKIDADTINSSRGGSLSYYKEKYLYLYAENEDSSEVEIYRHTLGEPESMEYIYTWRECENLPCEFRWGADDSDGIVVIIHGHDFDDSSAPTNEYTTTLQIGD